MSAARFAAVSTAIALLSLSTSSAQQGRSSNWLQFRGHEASGVADGWPLPTTWDVDHGTGVLWKTKIPGMGHACPVVADAAVYILTASAKDRPQDLKVGLYGDIAPAREEQIICS